MDEEGYVVPYVGWQTRGDSPGWVVGNACERLRMPLVRVLDTTDMDRLTPNPVTRTRVSAEVIGAMATILLRYCWKQVILVDGLGCRVQ